MRKLALLTAALAVLPAQATPAATGSQGRKVQAKNGAVAISSSGSTTQTRVVTQSWTKTRTKTYAGNAKAPANSAPSGPKVSCSVTFFQVSSPGSGQVWERNGASYALGTLTCSNGTQRSGLYCFNNCPQTPGAANEPQTFTETINGVTRDIIIIPLPTPDQARNQLVPILPVPRLSPELEKIENGNIGGYLVGIPMYFGLGTNSWATIGPATASSGGGTITVTGEPIRLDIKITPLSGNGDTMSITCTNPTSYVNSTNYTNPTNDCGLTFTTAGDYAVAMTITYRHTYTADPDFLQADLPIGELGISQTRIFEIPVKQIQPVIIDTDTKIT